MSSKPNPTGEQLPKTGDPFLDSVAADAILSQRETGVPASVTLAQALIESNRGKSGLSRKANNYFGIKGTGPAGSMTFPTREFLSGRNVMINAPFRKYNSAAESFADHGRFFIQNKRYHIAMQSSYNKQFSIKPDAHEFAVQIQRAGYATDPNYAAVLNKIIDQFNLTRFDKIAQSAPATQPPVQPTVPPTPSGPLRFEINVNPPTDVQPTVTPTPSGPQPPQPPPTPPVQPSSPTTTTQPSPPPVTQPSTPPVVQPPTPTPSGPPASGPTTPVKPPPPAQPVGGTLSKGMRGPEVGRIQDELILLGYLTLSQKLSGPGVFGPKTELALIAFQRDNHLTANGTYDPPTREAVRQISAGLTRNQIKNPVVEGMQDRLVEFGYMTSEQKAKGPGFFGPLTEDALKDFQRECGLAPDGIFTFTTYQVLYETEG